MLKNSFIHIPGIGYMTERRLWEEGVYTWEDFQYKYRRLHLSGRKTDKIMAHLEYSCTCLQNKDAGFFYNSLPKCESWRLYSEFKDKAVFLDIETTGLSPCFDYITVIGLFDGNKFDIFVAGDNMQSFISEIKKYSLVVTYNGSIFDLPFIKAHFPEFTVPAQIDLRFLLNRLGYSGGLKHIEKNFGIYRPTELQDIDGFEAVRLWHRYKRGDLNALKLLIEYNTADIKNLKILMEAGYKMMKEKTFPESNFFLKKSKRCII